MTDLKKVTDPAKIVTDSLVLKSLEAQGIDKDYVELWRDYTPKSPGKEHSPYARFYRDLKSGKRIAVFSHLPMVAVDGRTPELIWRENKGVFESGNNLFRAIVEGGTVTLTVLGDQPPLKLQSVNQPGVIAGDEVTYRPQLFIGGTEIKPDPEMPTLLEVDPCNENYRQNVLEWDCGVCRRRLRLVEGKFLGSWVFDKALPGDVLIRYNQSGKLKLELPYAQGEDTEFIPVNFFYIAREWPVIISDSATFYPDANPETSSVDGDVRRITSNESWADIKSGAGTAPLGDSNVNMYCYVSSSTTTDRWRYLIRAIMLFDTSSLPDSATISSAVLSVYCQSKGDELGFHATFAPNIYSSNPASNTALVAADYGTLGTTGLATAIGYDSIATGAYNDFTLNSSGIAAISKTGVSKFGLRDSYYDAGTNTPSWPGGGLDTYVKWYTADQGSGYKPKLVITYVDSGEKTSSDSGSGTEAALIAVALSSSDAGLGSESGYIPNDALSGDEGSGDDSLKSLVKKTGKGAVMRLFRSPGRVVLPHKEVDL